MENIRINVSLVNNSSFDFSDYLTTGEDFVRHIAGDDTGAPVSNVSIHAITEDGKKILISIPNDNTALKAMVKIIDDAPDEFTVKSTSRSSAECDEIILRTTGTTRLTFKPTIVVNNKNKYASVKGYFVFQKKNQSEDWQNLKTLNLSTLKSNEWVKLELKSAELLTLIKELIGLYRASWKDGIPFGEVQYIKAEGNLKELANLSAEDIQKFFELNKRVGVNIFSKLLDYITNLDNSEKVVEKLTQLETDRLFHFSSIVGLSQFKQNYNTWEANKENDNEEFWQKLFLENSFILSQLFSYPVVIVEGKAYVGGKGIANKGANLLDFLLKNELTDNSVLLEIKTPKTKLLGAKYRDNVYNASKEITGATIQLANYKNSLIKNYFSIAANSDNTYETFNPKCIVLAGNISNEIDTKQKRHSFELYRNGLSEIQIITYDELFMKVKFFIDLLESNDL